MIDLNLLNKPTVNDIQLAIANNLRSVRKRRKISQRNLADMSGVSFASIRRFEKMGEISLFSLTKLAIALGVENELSTLFSAVDYLSIEEVINEGK